MRALAAALLLAAVSAHAADAYPSKPLRFIVPYPPGGGNDFIARVIAPRLSDLFRQPVVIDNRGGAHGIIAAELTAKAPADGHTMLLAGTGHSLNPLIYSKLPYDSDRDFVPVSLAAVAPNILVVHPSVAANSVKELIALARPGGTRLHFGSSGAGGNTHLAGELFKLRTGANIEHVPYRGTGPAVTALLAGEMQMMFSTLPPALPQVRANRLRALGVTSAKRTAVVPDVPTISEAGVPGYESVGYWGVVVPGKTPLAIVTALNGAIAKVLASEDAKAQLFKEGIEAAGGSPADYAAFLKNEQKKWAKLIKDVNLKLE
ncbi:MAG TPA: tripartite tricarboxylate transporter substrate binding protein [Burkholderiales bacterium]|nr:tripartite tricarboxylate transporter substrate binding protein [Burkholderiales bacterium]